MIIIMNMTLHRMIVPSLGCPASCQYCFGPHQTGEIMSRQALESTARWIAEEKANALEITFHGGEPLTAGTKFYRTALPLLRQSAPDKNIRFNLQSNLWLLNETLLEIFAEHQVSIGTSLDGPELINDAQRGKGYFRRTMRGIEKARQKGLAVGCIVTFTRQSARHWEEILAFFIREGLNISIHPAQPMLNGTPFQQPDWALPPQAYGDLLVQILHYYLQNLSKLRIETLDAIARSIARGKGGICTFGDCLGGYLAVGPDGSVYPCQRFTGNPRFRLGSIQESHEAMEQSPVWQAFLQRQNTIQNRCRDCAFLDICRGGCPYNVLAQNQAGFSTEMRDPYCTAYQQIFTEITELATRQAFSPENLQEVVESPAPNLLRRGALLDLMSGRPHPTEAIAHARQTLAVVALGASQTVDEAFQRLTSAGVIGNPRQARQALENLHQRLTTPKSIRNNLYLHLTFECPLHCNHCYARGGRSSPSFPASAVIRLAKQASQAGFRHFILTGGEPLVHPEIFPILESLARIRSEILPMRIVLRTSLVSPLSDEELQAVANYPHEVVVSLDGDPQTHNARRGDQAYQRTVENLQHLLSMHGNAEVSLAAVLPLEQAKSAPGEHVRALARTMGIRRVRIRPLLPLGRAAHTYPDIPVEAVWFSMSPEERMAYGFTPASSCGLGQNLYIEPDGSVYPCYALSFPSLKVGNVLETGGLEEVRASPVFQSLSHHSVDSRQTCKECPYRYLCGGACRAWDRRTFQSFTELDQSPMDCSPLKNRAEALLLTALKITEVSPERWESAGLPLPQSVALNKH
ncbi:TIGR04083 family peptide-modifying radical SAM enzyme [Anaerolinea thermophila]|uniref:TIGR04083 family peptide-modifying radical SAM enzyme n=2 Tax=Anaerolinea TaxID=233189 RepID=UPI0034E96300